MDGQIETFVDNALNEMELQYLDGLLIHWPLPEYLERTWSKFLELKEKGKVKRIGICNVRSRHLYIYYDRGILPDIIQIERNPLRTCEKETDYCLNNNIEVQAYSPLCKMDKRLSDSLIISDIAQKYNKNIGQVILRWHIDTGVVPVFTSTKEERVCQYSELFDFSLNEEDVKRISSLNENYKIYLESCFCPGF